MRESYSIDISAFVGGLSGGTSVSTSGGVGSLTGLKFLSGGIQCIKAVGNDLIDGESPYFEVEAIRLNRILVTPSDTSPDAFVDFTLSISLFDQIENPWNSLTTLTVTSTSSHISGTLSGSTSSSTLSLQVYGTVSGTKIITVTSGSISSTCTVIIQQNLLKINSYSPSTLYTDPIFTTTSIDCTVCVFNSQTGSIITSNGPFSIQIKSLVNTLTGTLTKSTSNGCVSFTSLKIMYVGTTRLQAISNDKLPALGSQIKVKSLTLSITQSPSSVSSFFDLDLTITLRDETSFIYTPILPMTLTASSSSSASSSTSTSQGLAKFTIHYSHSGVYSIQASSIGYIKSASITINQDKILINSVNPKVIFI